MDRIRLGRLSSWRRASLLALPLVIVGMALVAAFQVPSADAAGRLYPNLSVGCRVNSAGKTLTIVGKVTSTGTVIIKGVTINMDGGAAEYTSGVLTTQSFTTPTVTIPSVSNGTHVIVLDANALDGVTPVAKSTAMTAVVSDNGCRVSYGGTVPV